MVKSGENADADLPEQAPKIRRKQSIYKSLTRILTGI